MTVAVDESYFKDIAEILDVMPERVIRYRVPDLSIIYCNAAWAAGHDLRPTDIIGHTLDEFLSAAESAGLHSQLARLSRDNPLVVDDVPRPAPNAPGQWVEWVDRYLQGSRGGEVLAVGRDVTGRYIAELNLADSEARFRNLADGSADVVWRFVTDPHPHFDYMSPSVERILGYPASVFLDDLTRFLDILDDEGRSMISQALRGELMPERFDLCFRRPDGSIVVGEAQTTPVLGGLQGVTRDVTELRNLQANLAALAMRDPLTGLANRRLLDELFEASLSHAHRSGTPLAVEYLDLDGFKTVNDTYGHDAGDIVLCETARRLRSTVRSADLVARIGGDEFVIVHEMNDPSCRTLVRRIERALSSPIDISDTEAVSCPASIGHADTRTVESTSGALLAAADAAMYESKRARCIPHV
jgi:diguanylate cyclase (GGDEF)-like protein/PAS domain S-box-containing protein